MASPYSFLSTHTSPSLPLRTPSPKRPLISTFSHRNCFHVITSHSPPPATPVKKLLDSFFVVLTSVAISVSVFIVNDLDLTANAFVVTPSKKLQTDELATVRLFQENTPSVVYITNLASRSLDRCVEMMAMDIVGITFNEELGIDVDDDEDDENDF
ncbi:hypothetical protein Tco_0873231 [Tanacetum coccineum]